ncbi:SDR family oxidoreductase [Arthrobacter sp. UCD-GKA]|uniref:SDR family NAD(P)-dependent oxidoreductase n=1 Tax=Arthrobacter sp. UCD-GKA TaxID=1913576 RepID=UPI0015878A5A|nr:SDR family oxidoreductase [Arthrobacter sp. UCD-GKA]
MPREQLTRPLPATEVDHARLFRLDGNKYVVLGAGGGIGEHVTRTIVGLGGRVLGADIDAEALAGVAGSVGMPSVVADATTESGMKLVAEAARAEFGTINGYIDVIGQMHRRGIAEYSLADWDLDFRTNLGHAFFSALVLAPLVEHGSIVHVSSVVASRGGLTAPGYGPAKAALQVWVKQLAAEHGSRGVRVNAVAPGLFLSPRYVAAGRSTADSRAHASRPLLGRLGQPHEIAAAIVFLLTPAAGYITGTTIPVEGGALSRDATGIDGP